MASTPCVRVRIKAGTKGRTFIVSTVQPGVVYGYHSAGDELCVHPGDVRARPLLFEALEPLPPVQPLAPAMPAPAPAKPVATFEQILAVQTKEATTIETTDDLPDQPVIKAQPVVIDAQTVAALAILLGEGEQEQVEPVVTEHPPAPEPKPVTPAKVRKKVRRLT